jgi:hypothetical protein
MAILSGVWFIYFKLMLLVFAYIRQDHFAWIGRSGLAERMSGKLMWPTAQFA